MSLTDEDKKWIAEQFQQMESRFTARLERVETTLLTEFHKWASPLEARMRTHSAALRALDLETEGNGRPAEKLEGGR